MRCGQASGDSAGLAAVEANPLTQVIRFPDRSRLDLARMNIGAVSPLNRKARPCAACLPFFVFHNLESRKNRSNSYLSVENEAG
jgi:hypothetical protein